MQDPVKTEADAFFSRPCHFVAGATSIDILPPPAQPEIAFIGRSNVGKSSLINALTGRNSLARTSADPGRTRQINFFLLADQLMLVDLPGYGYAKASKKDIKSWNSVVKKYLTGRVNLRRVYLLLDARRKNLSPEDNEYMEMFDDAAVSYQLVLTKADEIKKDELAQKIEATRAVAAKHGAALPDILATSVEWKLGISELRERMVAIMKGKE